MGRSLDFYQGALNVAAALTASVKSQIHITSFKARFHGCSSRERLAVSTHGQQAAALFLLLKAVKQRCQLL